MLLNIEYSIMLRNFQQYSHVLKYVIVYKYNCFTFILSYNLSIIVSKILNFKLEKCIFLLIQHKLCFFFLHFESGRTGAVPTLVISTPGSPSFVISINESGCTQYCYNGSERPSTLSIYRLWACTSVIDYLNEKRQSLLR